MMTALLYCRKKSRFLAVSFLLITQNISIAAGFQTLNYFSNSRVSTRSITNGSGLHKLHESASRKPQSKVKKIPDSSNNSNVNDVESKDERSYKEPFPLKREMLSSIDPSDSSQLDISDKEQIVDAEVDPDSNNNNNNNNKATNKFIKDEREEIQLGKQQEQQEQRKNQQQQYPQSSGRKLGLMWCSEDSCKDAMRERVLGEHNQIILDGPATGQVAYYWKQPANANNNGDTSYATRNGKQEESEKSRTEPAVLLLVKPNDDDLIKVAADAVKQLTNDTNRIQIYLGSSLAGKLKFQYDVDNKRIHLFEPKGTEGYGGHHVDTKDKLMSDFSGIPEDSDRPFDLICTLGGDGQLMHASMLFQGPVPPVISIAGGSLGFLTQFSRDEMVEAIKIALGVSRRNDSPDRRDFKDLDVDNVFPPNMPSYPYEPLPKDSGQRETPRFSFGVDNRICLSIRMRLDCRIYNREGVLRARFNVLNEVVIDRGSSPYLANLECFCDDVHLTTVQADGVIFATPTGSTAYSMAAGGSVVHPAVPCILVTPICPHVLSFRSMIFPDHVVLRCYVPDDARADAAVAFDGRYRRVLHRGDSLQIQMSPYPVPTLNRADHSSDWLGSLKRSFNFNTRPRQKPL